MDHLLNKIMVNFLQGLEILRALVVIYGKPITNIILIAEQSIDKLIFFLFFMLANSFFVTYISQFMKLSCIDQVIPAEVQDILLPTINAPRFIIIFNYTSDSGLCAKSCYSSSFSPGDWYRKLRGIIWLIIIMILCFQQHQFLKSVTPFLQLIDISDF